MRSSMTSHGLRLRVKTVTWGAKVDESSSVPRVIVTWSRIPLLAPKIGLPQAGQNALVTSLPLSEVSLCSAIRPVRRNRSRAYIAQSNAPRHCRVRSFRNDNG